MQPRKALFIIFEFKMHKTFIRMVVHEMSDYDYEKLINVTDFKHLAEPFRNTVFQIRKELLDLKPAQAALWFMEKSANPEMAQILDGLLSLTEQYATLEATKMENPPQL